MRRSLTAGRTLLISALGLGVSRGDFTPFLCVCVCVCVCVTPVPPLPACELALAQMPLWSLLTC
eukprot:COSAG06_NODE_44216_length_365_cov_0.962406_1_plen_63_part_01